MYRREWEERSRMIRRLSWTTEINWFEHDKKKANIDKEDQAKRAELVAAKTPKHVANAANIPSDAVPKPLQISAERKGFFDLPREVRDGIYELVLHQFPRQLYKLDAWVETKGKDLKSFVIHYDEGVDAVAVGKKAKSSIEQCREIALEIYKEEFGSEAADDMGPDELDEFYDEFDDHNYVCTAEVEMLHEEETWETLNWSHKCIHPLLDAELQARADYFIQDGIESKSVSALEDLKSYPAGTCNATLHAFVCMVASNPFLLRQAMMGCNEKVQVVLFYTGDFLYPLKTPEYYINKAKVIAMAKKQPEDGNQNAGTSSEQTAADGESNAHKSVKSDDKTVRPSGISTSDSATNTLTVVEINNPTPRWPFCVPPVSRRDNNWREPEMLLLHDVTDLKHVMESAAIDLRPGTKYYKVKGTVEMLADETTQLHLNKIWDVKIEFSAKATEIKDSSGWMEDEKAFWLNMWNGMQYPGEYSIF